MRKRIVAIIPARTGSVRVVNKNFINFYNNKNLIEIKIEQLKKIDLIDEIVLSSDSILAERIAQKYRITFHKRDSYYASSKCSGSEFFENLGKSIQGDYLMYTPCTSPIIKKNTYIKFIKNFLLNIKKNDSSNSVKILKEHIWWKGKALNYNPQNAPNSNDLPDNLYALCYGLNIIKRENLIKYKNIVGKKPLFYPLDSPENIDIDYPIDFKLAHLLYKNFKFNDFK